MNTYREPDPPKPYRPRLRLHDLLREQQPGDVVKKRYTGPRLLNNQKCNKSGISNKKFPYLKISSRRGGHFPDGPDFPQRGQITSWTAPCTYDDIFGQAHILYIFPETLGFWKRQTSWKPQPARVSPLSLENPEAPGLFGTLGNCVILGHPETIHKRPCRPSGSNGSMGSMRS